MKLNTYLKCVIISTVFTFGCDQSETSPKFESVTEKQSGYLVISPDYMSDKEREKYLDNMETQGWKLISYDDRINKVIFHKDTKQP